MPLIEIKPTNSIEKHPNLLFGSVSLFDLISKETFMVVIIGKYTACLCDVNHRYLTMIFREDFNNTEWNGLYHKKVCRYKCSSNHKQCRNINSIG